MEQIERFWRWFEREAKLLINETSLDLIDIVAVELGKIDPEITAEISNYDELINRELTITSHGNQSKFELIFEIIQLAPQISHWQFHALKPPRGFSFQVGGIEGLSLCNWRFIPLKSSPEFAEIGLRIEMPESDLNKLDDQSRYTIIEEGVGEVLLSLCSHIEYQRLTTSKSISLDSLTETLHSWAILRGPKSIHKFLPDIDAT